MSIYPWYHGNIGREEEESRLLEMADRCAADTVLYLVRQKTGSDRVG